MLVTEAPNEDPTMPRNATKAANSAAAGSPAHPDEFCHRHIGPSAAETREMLDLLGYPSLDALIDQAVPSQIRLRRPLQLPAARSEQEVLAALKEIASQNQVFRSCIGMGYYDCITPAVLQRNILENPGWYTPYTPYQAEIAQGRLEALLNFQTLVIDLTGLAVANASLLDEATAAAEAMTLCHSARDGRSAFFVSADCHPQTIDVVQTRAAALGIEVIVGDHQTLQFSDRIFGALVQYPNTYGEVLDYAGFVEQAHAAGALVAVATDLLSLTLLRPPGEFGADVAFGSAQRFGIPLGYGGPHAAFFATRDALKRSLPGRIVGVSKDSRGRPALRLALQTREQHIRREKATSNICTAQALLASLAAMYACYHGPDGLRQIAQRVHLLTVILARALTRLGYKAGQASRLSCFFDTLRIGLGATSAADIVKLAEAHRFNFRTIDAHTVGISLDETTTEQDLLDICRVFNGNLPPDFNLADLAAEADAGYAAPFARTSQYLTQPVFNRYHSETEMMRYLKRLESRDLSLTTSMIPLGSCTMKLNAAAEMFPITWPEFSRLHPFAPLRQARGYQMMFQQLEEWLAEITGFSGISLQPNAGSQGEYAGLLVIRAWHISRCEVHRNVCLIPTSAHGTNPASAVMAGLKVVAVACDSEGNIDVADLRAKAEANRANLAALMVTYPSTHGVFEESIREICEIVHANGGQVYMDGANLNAQVGLCRPKDIGADVCHMNLHKTFCIPHGGGGPGMGPIGVAEHLVDFLPGHAVVNLGGENPVSAVSAAPWGSASILPISWVYIAAMGGAGLTQATQYAILNANYIARRLQSYFPVLYRGHGNLVAHECILDLRQFKGVTRRGRGQAPDGLRLPRADHFLARARHHDGRADGERIQGRARPVLRGADQHPRGDQGDPIRRRPTSRTTCSRTPRTPPTCWPPNRGPTPIHANKPAFPAKWLRDHKFWPAVGRIDNVLWRPQPGLLVRRHGGVWGMNSQMIGRAADFLL